MGHCAADRPSHRHLQVDAGFQGPLPRDGKPTKTEKGAKDGIGVSICLK